MPDFPSDAERSRAGKIALRNRLLAARRAKTTPDRLSAAVSIQTVLLSLVRAQHPSTIAGYVPVGPEPGGADLPDVLVRALPPGGRLLLPVLLDDGDLDWAAYSGRLVPGPHGLSEPDGVRLGVDAIREASLVVVPALAVSRTGIRLGRGGGSYDRALSRLASATPPPALSPRPGSTAASPPPDSIASARPDSIASARPDSTASARPDSTASARPDSAASARPDSTAFPRPDSATSPRPDSTAASPRAGSSAFPRPDSGAAFPRPDSAAAAGSVGGPLTVALLYDGELVDVVPAEAHDRAVRAAITPGGGLTLSRDEEWTN